MGEKVNLQTIFVTQTSIPYVIVCLFSTREYLKIDDGDSIVCRWQITCV